MRAIRTILILPKKRRTITVEQHIKNKKNPGILEFHHLIFSDTFFLNNLKPLHYHNRIANFRTAFNEKKCNAFVTTFLPHVRYATGFSGSNALTIVTSDEVFLLTDTRYEEQVKQESVAEHIIVTRENLLTTAVKKKIFSHCKNIAIDFDRFSYKAFLQLKDSLKDRRFINVEELVEQCAAVKDEEELSSLRRAAEISDKVFTKILGIIKPGMRELEIAAEISYWHKKFGATGDSFDTIVASGINSAMPHAHPTEKKINRGDFVTLDFGCVYGGYCSDTTRTIAVGKPTSTMRSIYQTVLDVQQMAIDATRAGVSGKKLDAQVRQQFRKKNLEKYFAHSRGHGVGLQIHELPKLSRKSTDTLRENNVVTIEPGLYLPGAFGVRIEDDLVVRKNGSEVITTSPKNLIIL